MKPTEQEIEQAADLHSDKIIDTGETFHGFIADANWAIYKMQPEWVSVEECTTDGHYLVWNPNLTAKNKTERARYAEYNSQWHNDCSDIIHPTHFMPLPQPPTK